MTATVTAQASRRCCRCGRQLTSAASVARGFGRTCGRRIAAQLAVSDEKPEQVAKAAQVLADGGVEMLRPGRVWLVVGSKGSEIYRTASTGCTCPAGVRGRRCYHQLAVSLLAA